MDTLVFYPDLSECLDFPNIALLKDANAIITTVTLSKDCLYKEFFRTDSTASPHY